MLDAYGLLGPGTADMVGVETDAVAGGATSGGVAIVLLVAIVGAGGTVGVAVATVSEAAAGMVVGAAFSVTVSAVAVTADVCGLGISDGGVAAKELPLPPESVELSPATLQPPALTGDFKTVVEVLLARTMVGWLGFSRRGAARSLDAVLLAAEPAS